MSNKSGSKTDGILKLALFFFVSLFAFSVGTYVGKRFSENERRRMAYDKEFEAERLKAGLSEQDAQNISEADINKLSEEFVKAETDEMAGKEQPKKMAAKPTSDDKKAAEEGFTKRSRNTASAEAKPAEKKTDEKSATAMAELMKAKEAEKMAAKKEAMKKPKDMVKKAADRVAENKAPMTTPAPKRELARVLPKISPNSIGKYTVQVASYATEKEAKDHAKNLKDLGYSAFYLSAKVKSKVWYRVSVGLFDSKTTANNFKRELVKSANLKSAIIQKIIK